MTQKCYDFLLQATVLFDLEKMFPCISFWPAATWKPHNQTFTCLTTWLLSRTQQQNQHMIFNSFSFAIIKGRVSKRKIWIMIICQQARVHQKTSATIFFAQSKTDSRWLWSSSLVRLTALGQLRCYCKLLFCGLCNTAWLQVDSWFSED